MNEMFNQSIIALTGVIAIFLTQTENIKTRRWACIVGLMGQPFWLFATWQAEQWGIFVLSIFYTIAWLQGVKTYWIKAC